LKITVKIPLKKNLKSYRQKNSGFFMRLQNLTGSTQTPGFVAGNFSAAGIALPTGVTQVFTMTTVTFTVPSLASAFQIGSTNWANNAIATTAAPFNLLLS
jgi:hypothetical protein